MEPIDCKYGTEASIVEDNILKGTKENVEEMAEENLTFLHSLNCFQKDIYFKFGPDVWFFYTFHLYCFVTGVSFIINEYSTAFVIMFYAVERFILVVFPLKAKTILTKRNYIISVIGILIASALLVVVGSIYEFKYTEEGCVDG